VASALLEEGLKWRKKGNEDLLLLKYYFHNKQYLGAAHGLFGIVYILLQFYQLNKNSLNEKQKNKLL